MTNDTLAKLAADNVPERIYLVLGEDIAPDDDPRADFDELGEVTWCIDKQFENDVEYVRADVAALTAQALPAAEPAKLDVMPIFWKCFRHFPSTAGALTHTVWKDGIDIDKLSAPMQRFCDELVQAAQQAAQATAGWVSVEDRLPEINTEVLIAFDGIAIPSTGQYTSNPRDVNGWCYPDENRNSADDGTDPVVTHWQPLPQPPQPQGDA